MAHWRDRPEEAWRKFAFNQPFERGLTRLKDEVLGKTDFDPATLWQWGTVQAMAVLQVLKDCERAFGARGQRVVCEALRTVGLEVGRQILHGITMPEDMTEAEFMSFYATVINRIVYASLEKPRIESEDETSFEILWCPHEDSYEALDCRVQRYFVQGMIDAVKERGTHARWQVRFTSTIPSGGATCRFVLWRASDDEGSEWARYTRMLEEKALEIAKREGGKGGTAKAGENAGEAGDRAGEARARTGKATSKE